MPDHIHVLIVLPNKSAKSVSAFIRNFKAKFYHELRWKEGRKNSPWQRNYYDHIIRNDLDFSEKLNYIMNNPIKGRLTLQECDPEYMYVDFENLEGFIA